MWVFAHLKCCVSASWFAFEGSSCFWWLWIRNRDGSHILSLKHAMKFLFLFKKPQCLMEIGGNCPRVRSEQWWFISRSWAKLGPSGSVFDRPGQIGQATATCLLLDIIYGVGHVVELKGNLQTLSSKIPTAEAFWFYEVGYPTAWRWEWLNQDSDRVPTAHELT